MKFQYTALDKNGRIIKGEIEALDQNEVLNIINFKGLKLITLETKSSFQKINFKNIFISRRITLEEQIFLSKYLALMLKMGTALLQAINILIDDFDKPNVKKFLIEIRENLEKGNPFYVTFLKYQKSFSQVYINMIKAGEASGNLEKIFEKLTDDLTKQKDLKDQIKSALIYPIILLIGSIGITVFLVTFALPKIAQVFNQGDFQIPTFSKVIFSVGLFISKYIFIILPFFLVFIIFLIIFYKNSLIFRKFVFSILSELPVVKDLVKKMALQRFSSTLSSLIRAGFPLVDALNITADAVGNIELRNALLRIANEGLAKGLTVSESFKKEIFFPKTVVNLISISEKAGKIEDILETLADFYTKEIDSSLKTLVSFLEPIMLVIIGVIIGVIALAIIVPIYQLTTRFS